MAFPATSILDNFNRADENPIANGNWTGPVPGFTGQMRIVGNAATNDGSVAGSYWSASTFGPDCEVYLTFDVLGDILIGLRMASPAALSCYMVRAFVASNVVRLYRQDSGTPTQLGADFSQTIGVGDSVGLEAVGTTLTVYYKVGAGAWTSLGSRTDSTYSAAGYIWMAQNNDASHLYDEFGGGTIGGGPPPASAVVPGRRMISWARTG